MTTVFLEINMAILELSTTNPIDKVCLDVPLFIRLLEYAREEATTDVQLHTLTENILSKHREGADILAMDDYDTLLP